MSFASVGFAKHLAIKILIVILIEKFIIKKCKD